MALFPAVEFDTPRPRLPLDGEWRFSYDPNGCGRRDGWFSPDHVFSETIAVPGCAQSQPHASAGGYERLTDVAIPELSDTVMLRYGCKHDAWLQRKFTVPTAWQGQRIELHIGGVKPAGEFWLNGEPLGATSSSRSPLRADLIAHLRYGEENTLTARVYWPELQLFGMFDIWHAWSGLYRSVWIEAVPALRLTDIHIGTTLAPATQIHMTLRGIARPNLRAVCRISGAEGEREYSDEACVEMDGETGHCTLEVAMPGAKLWSPDAPHLYWAKVQLRDEAGVLDEGTVRFGVRTITTDSFRIVLNGTPIFLRGGCDDQVYPHTVCPPCDKTFFRERIAKAKKYGFNYTKSAVDIFTEEYLQAADELGYLVCIEMPFAALGEARDIRNDPPPELADLWRRELENIVTASRNHPCIVIYSMSSELPVDVENPAAFELFSRELPAKTRRLHPGVLIFDSTGADTPSLQTRHGRRDTDLISDCPEAFWYISPLQGALPISEAVALPFIMHEWNWITSIPNPDIAKRYETLPLVPVEIPEMIAAAQQSGIADELPTMFEASHRLKYALRKNALEIAYEHPKVAGYHHWLMHDVSYCPEGVFNEFWEEPEDLPVEEFRTYNGDTVLVLDDHDTRSFLYEREVPLGMTITHFGATPIEDGVLRWRLLKDGEAVSQGELTLPKIACGTRFHLASLGIEPLPASTPAKLELRYELWNGENRISWNHWPLWFFPRAPLHAVERGIYASQPLPQSFGMLPKHYDPLAPPRSARVWITHRLRDGAGQTIDNVLEFIERGGRVLLLASGMLPEIESPFYRTVAYNRGREGNMGTVIYPHPALGDFPHEGWGDFHFIPMLEGAYALRLDVYGTKIRPIIRGIGHHLTMPDKGYLFEAGLGQGVLLVCSLNLQPQCHVDPAAEHLLNRLIHYLATAECAPQNVLTKEQFKAALIQYNDATTAHAA
jgi:hypothetical protein